MKIGLASYKFINNDISFNISQMEKAIIECHNNVDLLCFGETFLQGFDCLNWDYENDKKIAVSQNSPVIKRIKDLSIKYNIDLAFGYIEKEKDILYSSFVVIVKGKITFNYRRITQNWKEYSKTDYHYQEGKHVSSLVYHGKRITIGLCGDLWLMPEKFKTDNLVIWPIYVNFTLNEWLIEENKYALQANLVSKNVLMVNSISDNPNSLGGSFYFKNGKIEQKLDFGKEAVLIIEIN